MPFPARPLNFLKDRFGKGQSYCIPFVWRPHTARSHVFLTLQLKPLIHVVAIPRTAGVRLQTVLIRDIRASRLVQPIP